MSESERYEEISVASEGITVVKTFEADAFPVPAIAFRLVSDRSEPVRVRLVDTVPQDVAVEDLGFHPEYGSEFWAIEDDEITFQRVIDPDEQYTTVYGIRKAGTDDVEQFLTEPTIAAVEEDADAVVGGGSDVVRDVIAGDTDSVPGLDDDEDEDIETLDLADPTAEEQSQNSAAEEPTETAEDDATDAEDTEDDTDDPAEEPATPPAPERGVESVAATLAAEIRSGEVDDDDLELLREELDLGGESGGGATDARIQKLQTDVSDLTAYIDALEAFLDDHGQADEIIDDVQSGLETVRTNLQELEGTVQTNSDRIDSLDDTTADLTDELESVDADVGELSAAVDDITETLDDIEQMETRIDETEASIEELQTWRKQLSSVLGAADE